jgi:hypothetical protein
MPVWPVAQIRPRGFGFGGGLVPFAVGTVVGVVLDEAHHRRQEGYCNTRVQCGSVGRTQQQQENTVYYPTPEYIPPPENYYTYRRQEAQKGSSQGTYQQESYKQPDQYYGSEGQGQQQANSAIADRTTAVLNAYNSVKDVSKLEFYVQRGTEANAPGAIRAKAGDLGKLIVTDDQGYITNASDLLGNNTNQLFKYDKRDNEIYTAGPAALIASEDIARFQRNAWSIREAVDGGNMEKARAKLNETYLADTNPAPDALVTSLNVARRESNLEFKSKDGMITAELGRGEKRHLDELYDNNQQLYQQLFSQANNIFYDRDHHRIEARAGTSAIEIQEFQRNAKAIGDAVDGNQSKAQQEYYKIHGADGYYPESQQVGQSKDQGQKQQTQAGDNGATAKTQGSPQTIEDLVAALREKGVNFNKDPKGNWVADGGNIKKLNDKDRDDLLGNGLVYDPSKNVVAIAASTPDEFADVLGRADRLKAAIGAPAQQVTQGTQKTDDKQQTQDNKQQTQTGGYQDFDHMSKQDRVADAQIMLESLRIDGGAYPAFKNMRSVDKHGHGIDGLQGQDTDGAIKDFKTIMEKLAPPTNKKAINSELDEPTFTRLVQNFQTTEHVKNADGSLDQSGKLDQATLKALQNQQTHFRDDLHMKIKHEVQMNMDMALNTQSTSIKDINLTDAVQTMKNQKGTLSGDDVLKLAKGGLSNVVITADKSSDAAPAKLTPEDAIKNMKATKGGTITGQDALEAIRATVTTPDGMPERSNVAAKGKGDGTIAMAH